MNEKFKISRMFKPHTPESTISNIVFLLIRLYAGLTIMFAGLDKLPLTDWMTDQVTEMGFPFPEFFAWIASFGEFAFGAILVLGLFTRFSGFVLAIIMGVASFGFQGVTPILEMHIAQHFFWIFVMFTFTGAGKFSLDNLIYKQTEKGKPGSQWLVVPVFILLLSFGLFREFNTPEEIIEDDVKIELNSISIPGSFNNWDPAANQMLKTSDDKYELIISVNNPQKIEFKFVANNSWDINLGELDQEKTGFPIKGVAELDQGNNTQNIKAYLPRAGNYRFSLNPFTFDYAIDTVSQNLSNY